jgi:hypothetical protein
MSFWLGGNPPTTVNSANTAVVNGNQVNLVPTDTATSTSVSVGNGATTIVTSPSLAAGTYLVGANFSISSTTTFSKHGLLCFTHP